MRGEVGEVVVRGSRGSDSDLGIEAISYGIDRGVWVLERDWEGLRRFQFLTRLDGLPSLFGFLGLLCCRGGCACAATNSTALLTFDGRFETLVEAGESGVRL